MTDLDPAQNRDRIIRNRDRFRTWW